MQTIFCQLSSLDERNERAWDHSTLLYTYQIQYQKNPTWLTFINFMLNSKPFKYLHWSDQYNCFVSTRLLRYWLSKNNTYTHTMAQNILKDMISVIVVVQKNIQHVIIQRHGRPLIHFRMKQIFSGLYRFQFSYLIFLIIITHFNYKMKTKSS